MTQARRTVLSCIVWVIICLVLSGLAGWITGENIHTWYDHLNKPSFNPPSAVFGPVWTVLYIMIGISGGLLWAKRNEAVIAFMFYIAQLFFNIIWSFIFFGYHEIHWAFVDIIVLLVFIFLTIIFSLRKSLLAALLLVPYFAWVIFAAILNYNFWQLN